MRFLVLASLFIVSCGTGKVKENPTNCAVKEVPEGVEFSCVDKDGKASSGIVKHGEQGAKGEPGQKGEAGAGLKLDVSIECKGAIEGWMEKSSYQIDYRLSRFETGDTFVSAETKLVRDQEIINSRSSSGFYLQGDIVLNDGLFTMKYEANALHVQSKGGIKAQLPCKELAI
jgi:hypothetical protein